MKNTNDSNNGIGALNFRSHKKKARKREAEKEGRERERERGRERIRFYPQRGEASFELGYRVTVISSTHGKRRRTTKHLLGEAAVS